MKIIVCVKQIVAPSAVRMDKKRGILNIGDARIQKIINPEDMHGLELALQIKDEINAQVIAIAVSHTEDSDFLRECLAMGADIAVFISDKYFENLDPFWHAKILTAGIKKYSPYEVIICGTEGRDWHYSQTGAFIAEMLQIPFVSAVSELKLKDTFVELKRKLPEGNIENITAKLPLLISISKNANTPRYPSVWGIYDAYNVKKIISYDAESLELRDEKLIPKIVLKSSDEITKGMREILKEETTEEKVEELTKYLKVLKILR